jgi:hypothetical protein
MGRAIRRKPRLTRWRPFGYVSGEPPGYVTTLKS